MGSFLETKNKVNCMGCAACMQVCPKNAITMVEDKEGFRYPKIDKKKCINCGLCRKVCPYNNELVSYPDKYAFGGYNKDIKAKDRGASGGAFSAIVDAFCDKNYIIVGVVADKLDAYHDIVDDKMDIDKFRNSKYTQSNTKDVYMKVKKALKEGKKVLFSGTPCQISALRCVLGNTDTTNLLLVDIVCEGVPSPLYVRKLDDYFYKKYNSRIRDINYRYTNIKKNHGKWDFQIMRIELENGKVLKKDRWFNPFWKLWIGHLMSRPSCYRCNYTKRERYSDITIGDLWGVHLYCPDLYGRNGGCSLVLGNTPKGKKIVKKLDKYMYGHELDFETALKYHGALRKNIPDNENREEFMKDLENKNVTYKDLVKKWYEKPSLKLLYQKYVWGNRQKIFVWNLFHRNKTK